MASKKICFPSAIFATFFHFKFNSTLTSVGKLNMEALTQSQLNAIDLFPMNGSLIFSVCFMAKISARA